MDMMEPNHIIKGSWNRLHSKQQELFTCSELGYILNKRSRRRMGESAEVYRRGGAQRYLHGMDEREEEIIRERKRGRYSEHGNKENFTDSLELGHYSRDRLPQMHGTNRRRYSGDRLPQMRGTNSTDGEKHGRHKRSSPSHNFSKGMFQRVSAVEYADHAASYNGGRLIKDDSRKMAYRRRDSDASFRQREPHCRRQVEGYSSFPKCLPYDQPDCRPCDRKRRYDAGRDNFLSRNSPQPGDRTTFKESHRSSRWKSNDDTFHMEKSKSLSWNGPKWGEETTAEDASMPDNSLPWNGPKWGEETIKDSPNSSKWRLDDLNHACDKDTDNSFPWSGPKWGEETNPEANSSQCKSVADNQDYNVETKNGVPCTDSKQGDEAHAEDEPRSRRSTTTKRGSNETKISSSWDDGATAKDVPSSLHRKRSYDSGRDNFLSRNSPLSGDRTTFKESHWSSRLKSNDDKFHMEMNKSLSWNGPKWGEETTVEDASMPDNSLPWNGPKWGEETIEDSPKSSKWRLDDLNHACDKETGNSFPLSGPKWGEETNPEANSSQCKSVADNQDYNGETKNGLPSTDSKQGDEAHTEDEPSSRRSTTTKRGSNGTKISSAWDDGATAKDVPSSLQRISDANSWGSNMKLDKKSSWKLNADEWGSNVKLDDNLSWKGQKWGDTQTKDASSSAGWKANANRDDEATKDAPGSPKWKLDADKCGSNVKLDDNLSRKGPKWGDTQTKDASSSAGWKANANRQVSKVETKWGYQTTTKSLPNSSKCRLDDDKQSNNVETQKSSWTGPKWDDHGTTEDDDKQSNNVETQKSSWNGPKWGSNVKFDDSLSWKGPKLGDKQTKDASRSSGWKTNANREVSNVETKWGYQTTTKSMHNSSRCRLDDDKQSNNVDIQKSSWNGPKWDDHGTTEDAPKSSRWGSDGDKRNNSAKTGGSSLDSLKLVERSNTKDQTPKWGGESTTKDTPSSHQRRSDANSWGSNKKTDRKSSWHGPKWGADVKTDNSLSWHGPKWGDEPTTKDAPSSWRSLTEWGSKPPDNKSSLACQKWDDKATKDAPGSPKWKLDVDKWGSNVKVDDSLSGKGSRWGDKQTKDSSSSAGWKANANREVSSVEAKWGCQTTTRSMPNSSRCRLDDGKQSNNVETQKSSWNGPKWDNHGTTEDDDKQSNNVETQKSAWNGPKWGSNVKFDDSLSWKGPKLGDKQTKDASRSSGWTANANREVSNVETKWGYQTTTKSMPNSSSCRLDDDRQSNNVETSVVEIITCVSTNFSRQSSDNKMDHGVKADSLSLNRLDSGAQTITQEACKRDFPSDDQNITCETSGKDQQHVLKILRSPSTIFNLSEQKGPEAQSLNNGEQSQYTSRHEALNQQMEHSISTNGQDTMPKLPSNGQGLKSDWHGHPVTREAKQVELIGDSVMETIKTKTGQSSEEETTSRPNLADCDDKGIRMFQFAIAEFVKEMIKPFWIEGHLTKEAHKTVVKKTVDKVVGALQVTDIPRTQKNIDLYISFAKSKLTDLVLAYLAKYSKR